MHRKTAEFLFHSTIRRISVVNRTPLCSAFHFTRAQLQNKSPVTNIDLSVEPFSDSKLVRPVKNSSISVEELKDFSNLNSEEFGTLEKERNINEKLDEMPEEEDDKIEYLVHDETGRNVRRNLKYYARIIDKLLKEKKIAEAIEILETRMKNDKVKADYYIYNLLISGCAKVGYTQKAFKLYNRMKKSQITPTAATYTGLFNACANSPFPEDALIKTNSLRKELADKGIPLNEINYNALIKAYGRLNDTRSAFAVVDEMLSKKFFLSEKTFTFLFQACASDEVSGFRHALVLWHKMKTKNVRMDSYVYNNFLVCVRNCGIGDVHEALDVIKQIQAERWKSCRTLPDSATSPSTAVATDGNVHKSNESNSSGNELVSAGSDMSIIEQLENRPNLLGRNPHLGSIVELKDVNTATDRLLLLGGFRAILDKMKEDKVKPDLKTFAILLDMIPSTSAAEEALLKEMKFLEIPIDLDFCNMLIKKRAFRRDYISGRATLQMIQSLYLNPDIVTFGVLALCCKNLSEANELIRDMNQFGYRMNIEILGGMLKNGCITFNYAYVRFIMQLMKKLRIKPSEKCMSMLRKLNRSSQEFFNLKRNRKGSISPPTERDPQHYENYKMFRDYYKQWKKEVTVYVPPHPYKQFFDKTKFNEDVEDSDGNRNVKEKKTFDKNVASVKNRNTSEQFLDKSEFSEEVDDSSEYQDLRQERSHKKRNYEKKLSWKKAEIFEEIGNERKLNWKNVPRKRKFKRNISDEKNKEECETSEAKSSNELEIQTVG